MKTIAAYVIAFLCGVGIVFAYRHFHAPPTTTTVVVLRDVTDTFDAQPDVGEIIELFDLTAAGKWNGARLLSSSVTDVSYNRVSEVKIEAANKWLSNELQRDKAIKAFQGNVADVAGVAPAEAVGRLHSSVYQAIAVQLLQLSTDKSDKKILLVYSDLVENEPGLSFYNARTMSLIERDPDSVAALLERKHHLPLLEGIEVYLIHQPVDAVADKQFQMISGFYRTLLESKGAKVHIAANLLTPHTR